MLDAGAEFFGFEKLRLRRKMRRRRRRLFGFFFFSVSCLLFAFWSSGLLCAERRWRRGGVLCGSGALIGVVPGPRHERERMHAERERRKKERFRFFVFQSSVKGTRLGAQKKKTLSESFCAQSPTSHQSFIERDGRLPLRAGDEDRCLGQCRAVRMIERMTRAVTRTRCERAMTWISHLSTLSTSSSR